MANDIDIENLRKQLEDITKAIADLQKAADEYKGLAIADLEKAKAILEGMLTLEEQKRKLEQEARIAREDSLKLQKQELELKREEEKLELTDEKRKKSKLENDRFELDYLREKLKHLNSIGEKNTKEYEKTLEQFKQLKNSIEALEEKEALLKRISDSVNKITGGYSDQILNLFSIDGIIQGIGKTFTSILETQQNLVKETGRNLLGYEALGRSLFLSAGPSGMAAMGVGVEQLGKAYGGLYTNFSAFSELTGKVQSDLASSAAKMENLGVASAVTAKNINELSKGLRFTAEEANSKLNQIAGSAIKAGIAPAKALNDLNAVLPQLSSNGKQAVDVFFALEKQSKALGMEMGDLLGIVGQAFDTFEGAAQKAGSLNAILGGDYLNSVEMLNATESERVEIMKRAFAASGQNFETMDRFQQKSIAMALGFKSAAEASKFFSNSSAENSLALEEQAKAQAELEKAQLAAAPVTAQLSAIFSSLAVVIKPLVDLLGLITTGLASLGPFAVPLIAVLVGLQKGFGVFGSALGWVKGKISGLFGTIKKDAVPAAKEGKSALQTLGEAGEKSGKGLMQIGVAMMLFGAGVGFAAYGLAELVKAFKGLDNAGTALLAITVVMIGFVAAIYFLSTATIAAGAPLGYLALVMLAIGGAIFLAAYGMSLFVGSFKGLGDQAGAVAKAVTSIMMGLTLLSVVTLLMLMVLPKTSVALGIMAGALIAVGIALYLTRNSWSGFAESLSAAGSGLANFGIGMKALSEMKAENLTAIRDVLKEISDVLEKMPKDIKVQVQGIYAYGVAAGAGMATGKAVTQPTESPSSTIIPAAVVRQQNVNEAIGRAAAPVNAGGIGAKASSENMGRTEVIIKIDDATQLRGYVLGPLASKILTGTP